MVLAHFVLRLGKELAGKGEVLDWLLGPKESSQGTVSEDFCPNSPLLTLNK